MLELSPKAGLSRGVWLDIVVAPFVVVARHRLILRRTVIADIRSLYAGSVLGGTWLVLGPLLMLAVYSVTYAVIFRFRPVEMTVAQYILYVFSGLVPFLAFSSGLSAGTTSLIANRGLLLNTVFPAELIPLRSVLAACVGLPVGVGILFVADLLLGTPSFSWLLVPGVIVLELMFLTGVCWILSLAALLLHDIQQIIYYVVMMLMVLAPIAYTPSMVPAQLKVLIYLNPAAYFVISTQSLIMLGALPPWKIVAAMIVLSVGVFVVGYHLCRSAKSAFYDFA